MARYVIWPASRSTTLMFTFFMYGASAWTTIRDNHIEGSRRYGSPGHVIFGVDFACDLDDRGYYVLNMIFRRKRLLVTGSGDY
jgi:hypothetical protein